MIGYLVTLLLTAALALVLVLAAWGALRLWRARDAVGRLGDERLAEDALRAQAEAVLAARLARGEIDRPTYEYLMERLWGLPPAPAAPREPPGGIASDRAPP